MLAIDRRNTVFTARDKAMIAAAGANFESRLPWEVQLSDTLPPPDSRLTLELEAAGYGKGDLIIDFIHRRDPLTGRIVSTTERFIFPDEGVVATVKKPYGVSIDPERSLSEVLAHMPGSHVEHEASMSDAWEDEPRPDHFWAPDDCKRWKEVYRHRIYPTTLPAITRIASEMHRDAIVHVDLFSNDGEMARRLHENGRNSTIKSHIFDRNREALELAKKLSYDPRITVHDPVDLVVNINTVWEQTGSPDIVTALGGFNKGVLRRDDALPVAASIFKALRPGGRLLVSGKTDAIVSAADYAGMGFTVRQKSIPANIFNASPWHFYDLQKPL